MHIDVMQMCECATKQNRYACTAYKYKLQCENTIVNRSLCLEIAALTVFLNM